MKIGREEQEANKRLARKLSQDAKKFAKTDINDDRRSDILHAFEELIALAKEKKTDKLVIDYLISLQSRVGEALIDAQK